MKSYSRRIAQSKDIQAVLLSGLIIQIVFCCTAVGYFHPDQHFQIIEFSSYQLGEDNATSHIWELASHIRPTLQVYLFSAFKLCCRAAAVNDPFHQLTILRILHGITFFIAVNAMAFYYCKIKSDLVLLITISLLNFSWFLPYSRTLFSSEMLSALVFFPSLIFYHRCYLSNKITVFNSIFTGLMFALSFFIRFQMAFALVGFTLWILFSEKQYRVSLYLLIGFLIGTVINIILDYNFYQKLVFTPYLYFKVNILDGVAASFGEQSFIFYIGVLIVLIGAPFISMILLFHYVKTSIQNIRHPLVLCTLFFIIGHFIVAHKEDRFMFTIINIIPIILALDKNAYRFFSSSFKSAKVIKSVLIGSIGLNVILLILFVLNPYSQTVKFETILAYNFSSEPATIYCIKRSPLETESHLPLTFYGSGLKNIHFVSIKNINSLSNLKSKPIWVTSTYNDLIDNVSVIDSLGYKPLYHSSLMLWIINDFLYRKRINTINDIWVLYKLQGN